MQPDSLDTAHPQGQHLPFVFEATKSTLNATFAAQVTEEEPLWRDVSYEKPLTEVVQKD